MALEAQFQSVADLNPLWPLAGDYISEGDNHLRGLKNVFNVQFGALGSDPLAVTASQINSVVDALAVDENGNLVNTITFSSALPKTFEWPTPLVPGNAVTWLGVLEVDYGSLPPPADTGLYSGLRTTGQFFALNDDGVTPSVSKEQNGVLGVVIGGGSSQNYASVIGFFSEDGAPDPNPLPYKGGMQWFTRAQTPYTASTLLIQSLGTLKFSTPTYGNVDFDDIVSAIINLGGSLPFSAPVELPSPAIF
jgi:hypothetical protein